MMFRIRRTSPAYVLPILMLFAACGCSSTVGKNVRGINNFAIVDHGPLPLYRGAQPSPEGYRTLAEKGVKTVIDLRDDALPSEQDALAHLGIKYVQIPSNAGEVDPRKIATFLERV